MPLFMLTVAVLAGLEFVGRILPRERRAPLRMLMAGTGGIYLGALLAVSLLSGETVLPAGAVKRFCGFYLDCHLGVAVTGVHRVVLPDTGQGAASHGTLYLVTLEASNDARRATLALRRLQVVVVDDSGRRYLPAGGDAAADPLTLAIRPGSALRADLAFELPGTIQHPRLLVVTGGWIDRLLESLLIGDEDSLLHAPTTLSLAGS